MRKNIGTIDATIRITAGLLGLAYGIGKMSRRPYRAPWLLMGLSAMKVAEGFTRYCPMLHAMGANTRKREGFESVWAGMAANGNKVTESVQNTLKNTKKSVQSSMQGVMQSGIEKAIESAIGNQTGDAGNQRKGRHETGSQPVGEYATQSGAKSQQEGTLSEEERALEKQIREVVTGAFDGQGAEGGRPSSPRYSHDEHHYPTYS